jgi:hypothetical protein
MVISQPIVVISQPIVVILQLIVVILRRRVAEVAHVFPIEA